MTEDQLKQHGGYRPGAGRKPSLKPLSIIRLRDPHIRAALIAVTAHQRQLSGNPQHSQEQVVADLILAAQRQLEKSNNQELHLPTHPDAPATTSLENINNQDTLPQAPLVSATTGSLENTTNQITYEDQLFAPATVITTLRREITPLVATLRTKRAVGQRDGKRLIALLTQLITLHAALITPWAILEELNRPHRDDAERDEAIANLRQRPLVEYRQDGWLATLDRVTGQLATGPIRRQTDQWDFINLAVEISGANTVTLARIVEINARLRMNGFDPSRWLEPEQAPSSSTHVPQPALVSPQIAPMTTVPPAPPAEITGVGLPHGKSHYLGAVGRTLCGHYLPTDLDDVTWIHAPTFTPTCRRCQTLFHPTFPIAI